MQLLLWFYQEVTHMKKLNKLAVLFATVAVAGSAMASGSTTNSDNWRNNHGNLQ